MHTYHNLSHWHYAFTNQNTTIQLGQKAELAWAHGRLATCKKFLQMTHQASNCIFSSYNSNSLPPHNHWLDTPLCLALILTYMLISCMFYEYCCTTFIINKVIKWLRKICGLLSIGRSCRHNMSPCSSSYQPYQISSVNNNYHTEYRHTSQKC